MNYIISEELANQIIEYLNKQPYNEVKLLIDRLLKLQSVNIVPPTPSVNNPPPTPAATPTDTTTTPPPPPSA